MSWLEHVLCPVCPDLPLASSVVHCAIGLAMERNLTINSHAVFKILYTDARLTCNVLACDAGFNCRHGEIEQQAIALLGSITME